MLAVTGGGVHHWWRWDRCTEVLTGCLSGSHGFSDSVNAGFGTLTYGPVWVGGGHPSLLRAGDFGAVRPAST
jgi:hypothetical protein